MASTGGDAVEESTDEDEKEDEEDEEDGEADLDLRSASDWLDEAEESTDKERLATIPESEELRLIAGLDGMTEHGELSGIVGWNLW
jgi:hypothetical protein